MSDIFVILDTVQYEKNGYQNRFKYKNKWITKPVNSGMQPIMDKVYCDGTPLSLFNYDWIEILAKTFGIKTNIVFSSWFRENRKPHDGFSKTAALVDIIKCVSEKYCSQKTQPIYITNPSAKDKYLDEHELEYHGIGIEYCVVPKNLQKSSFEILEEYGIEGAIKQLPKRKD